MTPELARFFLLTGVLLTSTSVSYSVWVKLRRIRVREDLYVIRDDLWDTAQEFGCLDDAAYIAARGRLHALILAVGMLSWPVMTHVARHGSASNSDLPRSDRAGIQGAIDVAMAAARTRVAEYIVHDCVSVLWVVFRVGIREVWQHRHVRELRGMARRSIERTVVDRCPSSVPSSFYATLT